MNMDGKSTGGYTAGNAKAAEVSDRVQNEGFKQRQKQPGALGTGVCPLLLRKPGEH